MTNDKMFFILAKLPTSRYSQVFTLRIRKITKTNENNKENEGANYENHIQSVKT